MRACRCSPTAALPPPSTRVTAADVARAAQAAPRPKREMHRGRPPAERDPRARPYVRRGGPAERKRGADDGELRRLQRRGPAEDTFCPLCGAPFDPLIGTVVGERYRIVAASAWAAWAPSIAPSTR